MLITISGMVGSGKSTTAAVVSSYLEQAGHRPSYVRFRYLNLLGFSRPQRQPERTRSSNGSIPEVVRGQRFTIRRLTAVRAAGYLVRILAFRISGTNELRGCAVVDRYFYDNFVQYKLQSRLERLYFAILRRLIPRPDVALLLVARDDTIAARRRNYDARYVEQAGRQYRELPKLFPNLIRIETDPDVDSSAAIRRVLSELPGVSEPRS